MHRSGETDERFDHWYDSELEFDCTFREMGDGLACVPLRSMPDAAWFMSWFADADCSESVIVPGVCTSVPRYGYGQAESCGVVTVSQRTETLSTVFFLSADGSCTSNRVPGYRIEEVVTSSLVTATRTLVADDETLGHWVLEASDGSVEWDGPIELASMRPCLATDQGCLADDRIATHETRQHLSDTCDTADVATWSSSLLCPDPRFVRLREGGFGALAEALESSELWRNAEDGVCELNTSDFGNVHRIRDIEPGDAPSIEVEDVASGRLRLMAPRSVDGVLLGAPDRTWFDARLGIDCQYHRDREGTERCVPLHATEVYFSDEECTEPVMRDRYGSERGWFRLSVRDSGCGSLLVGAGVPTEEYIGPVYDLDAGDCARSPNAANLRPLMRLDSVGVDELATLLEVRSE